MATGSRGNVQWAAEDLKRLDAWEFCRKSGRIDGESPVTSWPRLHSALQADGDESSNASPANRQLPVVWSVVGDRDADGHCRLLLSGHFTASVACLRCGQGLHCELEFSRRLRLCKSDQEADLLETEDDEDAVAAAGRVDVTDWLEDELLLSLPMFPTHPACNAELDEAAGQEVADVSALAGNRQTNEQSVAGNSPVYRPFEVLSGLIKKPGKP